MYRTVRFERKKIKNINKYMYTIRTFRTYERYSNFSYRENSTVRNGAMGWMALKLGKQYLLKICDKK